MTGRFQSPTYQPNDNKGRSLPGALLYFFEPNSTTPKKTYSNKELTSDNSHPVEADGGGYFPDIWLGGGQYRVILRDSDNNLIYDRDDLGAQSGDFFANINVVASVGQTVFDTSPVYTRQFFQVLVNGVESNDYTITGDYEVTFNTPLSGGETVTFIQNSDEVSITSQLGGASPLEFNSVADAQGDVTGVSTTIGGKSVTLEATDVIRIKERNSATFDVVSGTPGANGRDVIAHATLDLSFVLRIEGVVNIREFGDITDMTVLQGAIDKASEIGSANNTVIDVVAEGDGFEIDGSIGDSFSSCLKLKNYTRLTGGGKFKVKDGTYSGGNPGIIGNDQSSDGSTHIFVDDIQLDVNGTNNVISFGGAIGILFGRPIGPSGGPGAQGVDIGGVSNVEIIDNSFIGVQVKNECSQINIANIKNNGGFYAVQSSNSTQIDISVVETKNTQNNAVDVFGNNGDKFNISGKTGTYEIGETVTGGTSGATARLLEDNGTSLQMDDIVGTFTVTETLTGGTSGATSTYDSKEFVKGNFSGSIRGVHADGCLTGVFLESVSDVPVSDCVIKNPTGNGCIINRINSITSGNRVTNFTVEDAGSAGLLFSGEVTDNHCEISVDGATDGVRFNGSSFNSASDCKIKNVTNGYIFTGTGNRNTVDKGSVNSATTGVNISSSGQDGTVIDRSTFVGVTTRLIDSGTDSKYIGKDEMTVVSSDGGSNITPNLDNGTIFETFTTPISTNITINSPIGAFTDGQSIDFLLKQDGTGGNTVTFDAIFKFKDGVSTTANRRSHYRFLWSGTFWESMSEVVDF